ncbi:MAG: methyltransferase [Hyphomonadaceae bacterium]|nr:methyltransferase [Hyphomonadaceae bacterium]
MSGWRGRWVQWRNARLSDPRFQRFAADFPLTRPIARGRTRGLFDLVAGFVYSQVLAACVRLDIFNLLKAGPCSADDLAAKLDMPPEQLSRLLRAAAALDLVEPIGGQYALGPQGAALLGNAGLGEMIRHHDSLYADMQDPVGLMRRGRGEHLAQYWPYATSGDPAKASEDAVAAYSALMAATQPAVAADVLDAYPMRRHRTVMDVGGGEGAFLSAVGARWPHLNLRLFDLPAVVQRARKVLQPLASRATFHEGSFLTDPLPSGADLITLIRILHDHDDDGVTQLLASARAALAPGGKLLIAEPMSAASGRGRVGDAYFGFYLLAMGRGEARSPEEIGGFAKRAGFGRVRLLRVRTPSLLRVLVAET